MKTSFGGARGRDGFNRLELGVVVGTLALLGGLACTAIASSNGRNAAAGCLANLRQLQVVWAMYRDDNNDCLLPNAPAGGASSHSWCPASESESLSSSSVNTNVAAYAACLAWPYMNGDISILRCPGDTFPSANGFRLRSYSMNSQMGGIYDANLTEAYNANWRVYNRGSDLSCPAPSSAFVFCDEHPNTINDGYLQVSSGNPQFPDAPASYLDGACGFSFADGHGEIHRWQTPVLLIPIVPGAFLNIPANGTNQDWQWVKNHASCRL